MQSTFQPLRSAISLLRPTVPFAFGRPPMAAARRPRSATSWTKPSGRRAACVWAPSCAAMPNSSAVSSCLFTATRRPSNPLHSNDHPRHQCGLGAAASQRKRQGYGLARRTGAGAKNRDDARLSAITIECESQRPRTPDHVSPARVLPTRFAPPASGRRGHGVPPHSGRP